MSVPSKKSSKKKPRKKSKAAKEAVDLPDDEAIKKLFPASLVRKINKEIEHEPHNKEG